MKIFKISKQSITEAVAILRRGGTVVYPTETAYALGADAINPRAVLKIFKIKNRPKEKNLPVICASKKQVEKYFKMPLLVWKIWRKYWPKPVSIIMTRKQESEVRPPIRRAAAELAAAVLADKKTRKQEIPVRISSNKTARDLSRKLGKPIAATSANLSGEPTLYNIKKVIQSFACRKYQPDLILDDGDLPRRPVSTIVKINNHKIETVREGEVKI